jgi:hypothetical protein
VNILTIRRISGHSIASSDSSLDAVYVEPAGRALQFVVLICHGIGEIVDGCLPVQRLLAANGAASLVFDYSAMDEARDASVRFSMKRTQLRPSITFMGLRSRSPWPCWGFSGQ